MDFRFPETEAVIKYLNKFHGCELPRRYELPAGTGFRVFVHLAALALASGGGIGYAFRKNRVVVPGCRVCARGVCRICKRADDLRPRHRWNGDQRLRTTSQTLDFFSETGSCSAKITSGNCTFTDAASSGFSQAFSVLYGGFTGDGVVTAADMLGVPVAEKTTYNVFADLSGDGVVNTADLAIVKAQQGAAQH